MDKKPDLKLVTSDNVVDISEKLKPRQDKLDQEKELYRLLTALVPALQQTFTSPEMQVAKTLLDKGRCAMVTSNSMFGMRIEFELTRLQPPPKEGV